MKDKNNNYQPTTITALDNSVLNLSDEDLPDKISGLFVLSEYNTQYQQNQKKQKNRFRKKKIKDEQTCKLIKLEFEDE
ncbi:MAG: hypothetical protein ACOYEB_07360 [Enterococcus lemanii]|jgi:hypothetical protein